MLKKALLSTLLLLSNFAAAQINLDFDVTIVIESLDYNASFNLLIDDNNTGSFEDEFILINVVPQQNTDNVTVQASIYIKTEFGTFLISQPSVQLAWNTPATITLGNSATDEISIGITASLVD